MLVQLHRYTHEIINTLTVRKLFSAVLAMCLIGDLNQLLYKSAAVIRYGGFSLLINPRIAKSLSRAEKTALLRLFYLMRQQPLDVPLYVYRGDFLDFMILNVRFKHYTVIIPFLIHVSSINLFVCPLASKYTAPMPSLSMLLITPFPKTL